MCPACGREMLNKVTHFDCPNILCDYEEEIESGGVKVPGLFSRPEIPIMTQANKYRRR